MMRAPLPHVYLAGFAVAEFDVYAVYFGIGDRFAAEVEVYRFACIFVGNDVVNTCIKEPFKVAPPRGSPELRYHVTEYVYFAVVVDITCESTLGKLWHVQCDAVDGHNLVVIGKSIAAYRFDGDGQIDRRQFRIIAESTVAFASPGAG